MFIDILKDKKCLQFRPPFAFKQRTIHLSDICLWTEYRTSPQFRSPRYLLPHCVSFYLFRFQTTPYLHGRGRPSSNRDQNNNGYNFQNNNNTPTRAFTGFQTQVPTRNLVNSTFGNESNRGRAGRPATTAPRFGNRTWAREDGNEVASKKSRMVIWVSFFLSLSFSLGFPCPL